MAKDRHEWELLLAEVKVDHQQTLTLNQRALEARQVIAFQAAQKSGTA